MLHEFSPQDFLDFQNNEDAMSRYGECADRCLLFNFKGAIPPLIQDIVSDSHKSAEAQDYRCDGCSLTNREHKLAILLLIDSLL